MIILISVSLILFGLGACSFGYIRWKGKMHWTYFAYGFWSEANYMAIPGGIVSIIFGVVVLPITPSWLQPILIYMAMFVMLIGFLISWRLFKPNWVKWIEENHKEVIPHLAVEIRDYGWHAETQEELEEWIAEIRRKYGV